MKLATKEALGELAGIDGADIEDIISVNHRPHPFTIGARHVAHAADRHGGMLTEAVCRAVPCAAQGCRLPFDEHTSDRVAVIALRRDLPAADVREWLSRVATHVAAGDLRLDGFVFRDTGHRVQA